MMTRAVWGDGVDRGEGGDSAEAGEIDVEEDDVGRAPGGSGARRWPAEVCTTWPSGASASSRIAQSSVLSSTMRMRARAGMGGWLLERHHVARPHRTAPRN